MGRPGDPRRGSSDVPVLHQAARSFARGFARGLADEAPLDAVARRPQAAPCPPSMSCPRFRSDRPVRSQRLDVDLGTLRAIQIHVFDPIRLSMIGYEIRYAESIDSAGDDGNE